MCPGFLHLKQHSDSGHERTVCRSSPHRRHKCSKLGFFSFAGSSTTDSVLPLASASPASPFALVLVIVSVSPASPSAVVVIVSVSPVSPSAVVVSCVSLASGRGRTRRCGHTHNSCPCSPHRMHTICAKGRNSSTFANGAHCDISFRERRNSNASCCWHARVAKTLPKLRSSSKGSSMLNRHLAGSEICSSFVMAAPLRTLLECERGSCC